MREDIFIDRRERLTVKMGRGVGLFVGNVDIPKDYPNNCYEFSQDSTFRYFFGLDRAGLIGVIDFDRGITYISGTDFTEGDIVWVGKQPTILEAAKKFGVVNFIPTAEFSIWFKNFSEGREIFFIKPHRADTLLILSEILDKKIADIKKHDSEELLKAIVEMRSVKSKEEIEEIERAVNITRLMHLKAMEVVKPYMREYEVAAEVNSVAMKFNCSLSFQTICTKNSGVLSNFSHDGVLQEGDILLLDCGVKTPSGYCGDLTSIIPVSGKFSEQQKLIYGIVLEMFDAAVNALAPGKSFREAHDAACMVLIDRFLEMGILVGDRDEIFQSGAYALFFPHGIGHKMGLDVYDMENYGNNIVGYDEENRRDKRFGLRSLRLGRELKPGFVITVEPGIYFMPDLIENWKERGINIQYLNFKKIEEFMNFGGMRFERNFVVEATGVRRLGKLMPKTAKDVEEMIHDLKHPFSYR